MAAYEKPLKAVDTSGWSPASLAWLAGFYEGEGSLVRQVQHTRPQWRIQITSTDRDVLEKAAAIAGTGNIGSSYTKVEGHKPQWTWTVCTRAHVYALVAVLYPWLGERRRARAEECLRELAGTWPDVCRRGHSMEDARTQPNGRLCRICARERTQRYALNKRKRVLA